MTNSASDRAGDENPDPVDKDGWRLVKSWWMPPKKDRQPRNMGKELDEHLARAEAAADRRRVKSSREQLSDLNAQDKGEED